MFTHIAVVRDLVDMQYKEYQEVNESSNQTKCFYQICMSVVFNSGFFISFHFIYIKIFYFAFLF